MNILYNSIVVPAFPEKEFLITDYYNGTNSLYTAAIHEAIRVCAESGGGKVIVPAGEFHTAPIYLRSKVNLHISEGAILKFITDVDLFDVVFTRIEGIECYNLSPLIYAYEESDIAVTGKGILDGQATEDTWFARVKAQRRTLKDGTKIHEKSILYEMKENQTPLEMRVFKGENGIRPQFINFYNCQNILLEDITLHNSPFWLIHPLLCENVTIRGVTIDSHGGNNDGCDPESCRNVVIENCYFNTGDDCIAIKSGRDEDGRRWNVPSENIIVRNCVMKDGHAGVAIGSEVTGGCRNVWVENCRMDSPNLDRIIRIKSNAERGGEVENLFVRNLEVGECKEAILRIEMKYWRVYDGPYLPYFHNIHLENISSKKSQYGIFLDGFEDKIQIRDIYIRDCDFQGVTEPELNKIIGAENVVFENVKINGEEYFFPL